MTSNETKEAAKNFLSGVLQMVNHKELILQSNGQLQMTQVWIAAAVVAGVIKPEIKSWATKWDTARALDAVETFHPKHPIALEWKSLKANGLKPATRGRGRSKVHGRNLVAVHFVAYLVESKLAYATRNHHEASKHKNDNRNSACDIVAEVLNPLCSEPVEYHAIRSAWEKRDELFGTTQS